MREIKISLPANGFIAVSFYSFSLPENDVQNSIKFSASTIDNPISCARQVYDSPGKAKLIFQHYPLFWE